MTLHVFLDLECTCWPDSRDSERMETIEIGAVKYDELLRPIGEFTRFIRPVVETELSPFCTRLTSIEQKDVDGASLFPEVLADFVAWAGREPLVWYSWGAFDRRQLVRDIGRHTLSWPPELDHYVNLKEIFAGWAGLTRPIGMMRALRLLDIPFNGRHHRAIDDARHVARIAQVVYGGGEADQLIS